MLFPDSVIESIASPSFLVGPTGEVLRINRHGYTLLARTMQINQIRSIYELDPEFDISFSSHIQQRTLRIGKLKLNAHLYPCVASAQEQTGETTGILYIIDNILFNAGKLIFT